MRLRLANFCRINSGSGPIFYLHLYTCCCCCCDLVSSREISFHINIWLITVPIHLNVLYSCTELKAVKLLLFKSTLKLFLILFASLLFYTYSWGVFTADKLLSGSSMTVSSLSAFCRASVIAEEKFIFFATGTCAFSSLVAEAYELSDADATFAAIFSK